MARNTDVIRNNTVGRDVSGGGGSREDTEVEVQEGKEEIFPFSFFVFKVVQSRHFGKQYLNSWKVYTLSIKKEETDEV